MTAHQAEVINLADRRRAAVSEAVDTTEPEHGCCWGIGDRKRCGRTDTLLYPGGWRCPLHTPAALAGQDEPSQVLEQWEAENPGWHAENPTLHEEAG